MCLHPLATSTHVASLPPGRTPATRPLVCLNYAELRFRPGPTPTRGRAPRASETGLGRVPLGVCDRATLGARHTTTAAAIARSADCLITTTPTILNVMPIGPMLASASGLERRARDATPNDQSVVFSQPLECSMTVRRMPDQALTRASEHHARISAGRYHPTPAGWPPRGIAGQIGVAECLGTPHCVWGVGALARRVRTTKVDPRNSTR